MNRDHWNRCWRRVWEKSESWIKPHQKSVVGYESLKSDLGDFISKSCQRKTQGSEGYAEEALMEILNWDEILRGISRTKSACCSFSLMKTALYSQLQFIA
jgi:hypothetical protein